MIVYDIPYRTGVRLDLATLLTLAGHPNIHAITDCAGSLETTLALILDGRLSVLAGEDLNMSWRVRRDRGECPCARGRLRCGL